MPPLPSPARRALLRFMLASPVVGGAAGLAAWWPGAAGARPEFAVPDSVGNALDVFQFKAAARRAMDDAAWHFVVNGADGGRTMDANREAFERWQIRVRRLVDVSRIDTALELFGQPLDNPILLAPTGVQTRVHPEGELATARGAGARHVMICSTVSSYSIDEIAAVARGPLWFQLYSGPDPALDAALLRRAEAAGCGVVALTVDSPTRGNRLGEAWFASPGLPRFGNFEGIGPPRIGDASMTWDVIARLRDQTRLPLVLKGLVTGEDARLAVRYGVDGIIVSNHGGRQEDSGRGTLDCLEEVVDGAGRRMPVLIDGGFRRGSDIFKALALGARAVCIGRPYLWGLGAFGEAGVDRVLDLLRAELTRIMQFAGTRRLADIGPRSIERRA